MLVGIQNIQNKITANLELLSLARNIVNLSLHNGNSIISFKTVHINVSQNIILLIHLLENLPGNCLADFLLSEFVLFVRHATLVQVQILPHSIKSVLEFSLNIMIMLSHKSHLVGLAESVHSKFILAILSQIWVSVFRNHRRCEEVGGLDVG